ncbi:MAG TPA: polyprenol monophosphomannose synthase [Armatimonadota bacterium]|jgi:dolichol-phosphate mannosyltransferase|nr:polyprenol monophosphomannose synthase [Armatimonadota bacterium]
MQHWVCVATYNERENIESLIETIDSHLPGCHVIVVDDESPDGTGDLLDALAAWNDRLHPIRRPGKMGYASAHRTAIAQALASGADVVFTMDADWSHDPKHLPELMEAIEDGADLALGSRYVPGGGTEGWPWPRRVLSATANAVARRGLAVDIRDCTSGLRAYRATLLNNIRFDELSSEGYCFLEEMVMGASLAGAAFAEVPITFVERRAGKSKMSRKVILEAMVVLAKLSWQRRFARESLRRAMLRE